MAKFAKRILQERPQKRAAFYTKIIDKWQSISGFKGFFIEINYIQPISAKEITSTSPTII
jgi:hypothetical protein